MSEASRSRADLIEAVELEQTADWRIRKLGENPDDRESAAAAELLQSLADDLRRLCGSPVFEEYRAIRGWVDEFDDEGEAAQAAHRYRLGIGVEHRPEDGEGYLRALIGLLRKAFGS